MGITRCTCKLWGVDFDNNRNRAEEPFYSSSKVSLFFIDFNNSIGTSFHLRY